MEIWKYLEYFNESKINLVPILLHWFHVVQQWLAGICHAQSNQATKVLKDQPNKWSDL